MIKTFCIFYDGNSSVSQKIELTLDEDGCFFQFNSSNNEVNRWAISDVTFERNGTILNIQYGNNPIQHIKLEDVNFIAELDQYLKKNGHLTRYQKLINLGFKAHIAIASLIIGFIIIAYIFVVPWVAEQAVALLPQEYDNELGSRFFDEYI